MGASTNKGTKRFDFSSWSDDQIKLRLDELRRSKAAIEAEELALLLALDRSGAFEVAGATSTAAMIAQESQISPGAAQGALELANALEELPLLGEAFGSGELSREVTRELSTFITPENEAEIVTKAKGWSAPEARRIAREAKAISEDEQRSIDSSRELRFTWSKDKTHVKIAGRLGAEGATPVISMIEWFVKKADKEASGSLDGGDKSSEVTHLPFHVKAADALVALASVAIGDDARGGRAMVSLHVDYETLVGSHGLAQIGAGYVSPEVARRIACDARLEIVLDDPYGLALGVGRSTRTPPPWLVRQIRRRDQVCIFPGCERSFFCDVHHIIHWADGGPTDYDNLALMCSSHHSLVHEGGWSLTGSVPSGLTFVGLWGEKLEVAPWEERRPQLSRGLGNTRCPGKHLADHECLADHPPDHSGDQECRGNHPPDHSGDQECRGNHPANQECPADHERAPAKSAPASAPGNKARAPAKSATGSDPPDEICDVTQCQSSDPVQSSKPIQGLLVGPGP